MGEYGTKWWPEFYILYMRLFSIVDQFEMLVRAAKLSFGHLPQNMIIFLFLQLLWHYVLYVFALSIITALKTSLWSKLQSNLTMPGM